MAKKTCKEIIKKINLIYWVRWHSIRWKREYQNDEKSLIKKAKEKLRLPLSPAEKHIEMESLVYTILQGTLTEEETKELFEIYFRKFYAKIIRLYEEIRKYGLTAEKVDVYNWKRWPKAAFEAKTLSSKLPPPELEEFQKKWNIPFPLSHRIKNPPFILILPIQESHIKIHHYDIENNTLTIEVSLNTHKEIIMAWLKNLLDDYLPKAGKGQVRDLEEDGKFYDNCFEVYEYKKARKSHKEIVKLVFKLEPGDSRYESYLEYIPHYYDRAKELIEKGGIEVLKKERVKDSSLLPKVKNLVPP